MADKPYHQMTDDELRQAHLEWSATTANAAGWSSAYCAAQQVQAICREADRRALGLKNDWPIRRVARARNRRDGMDEETKQAILYDSAYVAGMKAGYNLGLHEEHEKMNRLIEQRINDRAEIRPAHTQTAIQNE